MGVGHAYFIKIIITSGQLHSDKVTCKIEKVHLQLDAITMTPHSTNLKCGISKSPCPLLRASLSGGVLELK